MNPNAERRTDDEALRSTPTWNDKRIPGRLRGKKSKIFIKRKTRKYEVTVRSSKRFESFTPLVKRFTNEKMVTFFFVGNNTLQR